ncbi:MAG: thiamine phosphate synthase [Proteobacteria bacterium]|jgi:thiamine-phosphate pyrophosphorylase|nr:thiamine phosphate synthase [Desulfocapsa sp.]MBU3943762.1 thiamine phosphate synthase [Pseudomonadota bacterium]MCG2744895.1 thiamine phosphate synthase [Desulfobacteraceae bacterium]MBU3982732.1 thiamine phosphate synthase [Pseudomonadota bacterium]MBU4029105.1 thiamine phosphate synthase [Pseudomonadota bacterium]
MVRENTNHSLYERRLRQFVEEVTLYPVSCEKLALGRTDREWLDGVLAGGARIVQLRDKESNDSELLAKARYFREKTQEAGALFLLNDRLDIALLADADGMHVGQNDLPPDEIRKLAPDFLIGLSCNTQEQAKKLGNIVAKGSCPVAYFNIGPVYSTATKKGLREFVGPQAVEQFTKVCPLPFTVMGGIKSNHIKELCAVGVKRIAVVTAISQATNIAAETACWIQEIYASSRDAR